MRRYIDADKLIDDIRPFAEYDSNLRNKDWVRRFEIAIDNVPTADVRENVKGKWLKKKGSLWTLATCSVCGELSVEGDKPFCPNCGAEMRGTRAE